MGIDLSKAIYEFLVATLPAVVLYFVGWAYLYFFLGSFGISSAEVHIDTATIFVYAFSPLQITTNAHGLWVVLFGIAVTVALVWIVIWFVAKFTPSNWFKITILIILLIFSLPALLPFVKWAATQQKTQVWSGKGAHVIALLAEKSAAESQSPVPQGSLSSFRDDYMRCSREQALLLIYSDEKAYYLLCKSVDNDNEAYVFEVRRESGLSSVRFAGGQQ